VEVEAAQKQVEAVEQMQVGAAEQEQAAGEQK
jgi:hypothetical protein